MRATNIEIGGKNKRLRYDFNAVADIEEKSGKGLGSLFNEQNIGLYSMRLLLWGGLKWEDPGLTIQRTGQMIQQFIEDGNDLEDLTPYIEEAINKSGLFGSSESSGESKNAEAE